MAITLVIRTALTSQGTFLLICGVGITSSVHGKPGSFESMLLSDKNGVRAEENECFNERED